MSCDVLVRVRGLGKSYPVYQRPWHRLMQQLWLGDGRRWRKEFSALRDVDFELGRGETVGIVGRNGSGKSTLLQLICGTLTPTVGSVEVNGRIAALLELGSGFNPEFTGRENVYMNGTVLGLTRREVDARYEAIAAFADIGSFIDQPVKTYSSGMQVRLAFAVAINVDAEILVVDEALAVGDEAFQRKCFARLRQLRDAGASILFVSHSAGTVLEICDRAVLLEGGDLVMNGEPREVVTEYHRRLYAPEGAAGIKGAARSGPQGDDPGEDAAVETTQEESVESGNSSGAVYDPQLVSDRVVTYESRGAAIRDVRLENAAGRRVNLLNHGQTYFVRFRAEFTQTVCAVRAGMLIKTITGIGLGGAATATHQNAIPFVESGSTADVAFEFRCMLLSGTYFLNAGVLAMIDGEEVFIDRCVDAAMIRVLPDADLVATEYVDFDVRPTLSIHSATSWHDPGSDVR